MQIEKSVPRAILRRRMIGDPAVDLPLDLGATAVGMLAVARQHRRAALSKI
jgi:hypothetical protein